VAINPECTNVGVVDTAAIARMKKTLDNVSVFEEHRRTGNELQQSQKADFCRAECRMLRQPAYERRLSGRLGRRRTPDGGVQLALAPPSGGMPHLTETTRAAVEL
jgi:hypothetical protein